MKFLKENNIVEVRTKDKTFYIKSNEVIKDYMELDKIYLNSIKEKLIKNIEKNEITSIFSTDIEKTIEKLNKKKRKDGHEGLYPGEEELLRSRDSVVKKINVELKKLGFRIFNNILKENNIDKIENVETDFNQNKFLDELKNCFAKQDKGQETKILIEKSFKSKKSNFLSSELTELYNRDNILLEKIIMKDKEKFLSVFLSSYGIKNYKKLLKENYRGISNPINKIDISTYEKDSNGIKDIEKANNNRTKATISLVKLFSDNRENFYKTRDYIMEKIFDLNKLCENLNKFHKKIDKKDLNKIYKTIVSHYKIRCEKVIYKKLQLGDKSKNIHEKLILRYLYDWMKGRFRKTKKYVNQNKSISKSLAKEIFSYENCKLKFERYLDNKMYNNLEKRGREYIYLKKTDNNIYSTLDKEKQKADETFYIKLSDFISEVGHNIYNFFGEDAILDSKNNDVLGKRNFILDINNLNEKRFEFYWEYYFGENFNSKKGIKKKKNILNELTNTIIDIRNETNHYLDVQNILKNSIQSLNSSNSHIEKLFEEKIKKDIFIDSTIERIKNNGVIDNYNKNFVLDIFKKIRFNNKVEPTYYPKFNRIWRNLDESKDINSVENGTKYLLKTIYYEIFRYDTDKKAGIFKGKSEEEVEEYYRNRQRKVSENEKELKNFIKEKNNEIGEIFKEYIKSYNIPENLITNKDTIEKEDTIKNYKNALLNMKNIKMPKVEKPYEKALFLLAIFMTNKSISQLIQNLIKYQQYLETINRKKDILSFSKDEDYDFNNLINILRILLDTSSYSKNQKKIPVEDNSWISEEYKNLYKNALDDELYEKIIENKDENVYKDGVNWIKNRNIEKMVQYGTISIISDFLKEKEEYKVNKKEYELYLKNRENTEELQEYLVKKRDLIEYFSKPIDELKNDKEEVKKNKKSLIRLNEKILKYSYYKNKVTLESINKAHEFIVEIFSRLVYFTKIWERDMKFFIASKFKISGLNKYALAEYIEELTKKDQQEKFYKLTKTDKENFNKKIELRNEIAHYNYFKERKGISLIEYFKSVYGLFDYSRKRQKDIVDTIKKLFFKYGIELETEYINNNDFKIKESKVKVQNIGYKIDKVLENKEKEGSNMYVMEKEEKNFLMDIFNWEK